MPEVMRVLTSVITCPHCGHAETETMPTDACLYFYECTGCGERLRPKPGDCCVFCSFGSVPCPPTQERASDQTPQWRARSHHLSKRGPRKAPAAPAPRM